MSKKLKKEIENIVQIVSQYPLGGSIEEILSSLATIIPKRTLQYRLSSLVKLGILRHEGHVEIAGITLKKLQYISQ